MHLNDFVAAYLTRSVRSSRDFEGDRGWIHLANLLFRKLERNGMFAVFKEKEVAVEVDSEYWIDRPSDMRLLKRIYYPYTINSQEPKDQITIAHENLNGKIKLETPFTKNDDPTTYTLSNGNTTQVELDDGDAAKDEFSNNLLVLTDGTYSGDNILLFDNDAGGAGVAVCRFRHTHTGSISDSTAGYLTEDYLMLVYIAKYTNMTAYDGEIPLDSNYEDILEHWFNWKSLPIGDKDKAGYKKLFEETWEDYENEIFTPTEDQARQQGRRLIGLEGYADSYNNKYGYTGDR